MKKLNNMRVEVNYKILNPGGNKTAIVLGNNYTDDEKKLINNDILKENSDVEQVGFISMEENRLEMAGGEFCVNATRCAIWEYLKGRRGEIEINVSGCNERLIGGISNDKEVYVNMKMDNKINDIIYKEMMFNFVELEGILLAIVDEQNSKEYIKELNDDEEKTKEKLKEIMKSFVTTKKAVGIIFLENENTKIKINPVIWVKTVDTLYYETACGSGSLATAIYINWSEGIDKIEVLQPSGYSIDIKLNINKEYIQSAIISGRIIDESKNVQ